MQLNFDRGYIILQQAQKIISIGLILFFFIVLTGCEQEPTDPLNSYQRDLPVPDRLIAQIINNTVTLSWNYPAAVSVEKFLIYRKESTGTEYRSVGETSQKFFRDLLPGSSQPYHYQVQAIGRGGHLSPRSLEIQVASSLFSISISGISHYDNQTATFVKYTNQTSVSIHCTAPAETDSLWISNDSTQLSRAGRTFNTDINWTLLPGDGLKRVYARLKSRFSEASYTLVSDSIVLDTRAQILNITENSGGCALTSADTLHLRMETIDRVGTAQISIGNWQIPLYNDGTHGDQLANDHIFEVRLLIPASVQENQARLSGRFIDVAGNEAQMVLPYSQITINRVPIPVQLFPVPVVDADVVTLHWTENIENDFANYQVFHSNQSELYNSQGVDTVIMSRKQTRYTVRWLTRNQHYYFKILVTNSGGRSSWSNEIMVRLKPEIDAPMPIVLAQPQTIRADSISLTWSQNRDANFAAYYIYRSEQPITILPVTPIAIKNQREQTSFIDFNLRRNQTYYYRIAVFNLANQYVLSNQVNIQLQP